ncbi:sensor histidine kinase [Pseudonocardia sp. CA-107938]|uniref:sensor histidine kinase n=1 Tax=Pseudonocardia sp. CA-107938 TaxID=3240021 RepID=UPI003D9114F9
MTVDPGPLRTAANLVWLPLVLLGTAVDGPSIAHVPATIAACAVASIGWIVLAVRRDGPPWLTVACVAAVGAAGVAATVAVGHWSTPMSFCLYAVVVAAVRLPTWSALVTLATLTGGLWLALLALDPTEPVELALAGTALAAGFLLGLGRRQSRERAEQQELTLASAARANEEHARAAALAERTRIARDVHDVLAHSLSALAVQLQGARLMLERDGAPADTRAQVERAQRLAQDGLAEARRAVTALRSEPPDLADGLRALVADTPHASLEIDSPTPPLSAQARETVLRTAQEALSNVRKHAAGAPVAVRLHHADGATSLEVHDLAGAPAPRDPSGWGLVGMQERAALAGATLDAGPVADGWRVRLVLPDEVSR